MASTIVFSKQLVRNLFIKTVRLAAIIALEGSVGKETQDSPKIDLGLKSAMAG
jgi:hypothetical protein